MNEFYLRLKFIVPSLGNCKRPDGSYTFNKDADTQKVVFLPSLYLDILNHAAKLLNRHHQLVRQISFGCAVDGVPSFYRRATTGKRFAWHEAYKAGDIIGVTVMLPAALTQKDFLVLIAKAGEYGGLSPFKPREYGRFVVDGVDSKSYPFPNG